MNRPSEASACRPPSACAQGAGTASTVAGTPAAAFAPGRAPGSARTPTGDRGCPPIPAGALGSALTLAGAPVVASPVAGDRGLFGSVTGAPGVTRFDALSTMMAFSRAQATGTRPTDSLSKRPSLPSRARAGDRLSRLARHDLRLTIWRSREPSPGEGFDPAPHAEAIARRGAVRGAQAPEAARSEGAHAAGDARGPEATLCIGLAGGARLRDRARRSPVGLVALHDYDGCAGFELWVGGGARPVLVRDFLLECDLLTMIEALLRVAERHAGLRAGLARGAGSEPFRALAHRLGPEVLRREVHYQWSLLEGGPGTLGPLDLPADGRLARTTPSAAGATAARPARVHCAG